MLSLPIHPHFIFDVLAYFLGWKLFKKSLNQNQDNISEQNRIVVIAFGAIGALLGAHLIGIMEDERFWTGALTPLEYISRKSIVGGLVGATFFVELGKFLIGEKNRTGDILVFPLLVSIGVGRIGCFLTGVKDHTVGIPTTLITGLDQGDGVLRHPTSLYEIIFLSLVFAFLYFNKTIFSRSGKAFRVFMMLYLGFRFLVEFIKPRYEVFLNLSPIQIICFITLIYFYGRSRA